MKMRWIAVFVLIVALTLGAQAYERTVLVEYISNTYCGPCGFYYYEVENFLAQYTRDEAAFMVYHVNWPGASDWYYVANPSENMARRSYYGTNSVPYFAADGAWDTKEGDNYYTFSYLSNTIASRVGSYAPVEIVVDGAYLNFAGEIQVDLTLNSDIDLNGCRLQVILLDLATPYGTAANGIDYVYNMLDMYPTASGTDVSDITAGGSASYSMQFPMWDDHEATNYGAMIFVQDQASKEVHQAKQVMQVDILYPLLSVVSHEFDDADQAMPNGRPDPGETVDLTVLLQNDEDFLMTDNLIATLSCDNDAVDVTDDEAIYTDIVPGTMMNNASDPFTIEVPNDFEADYVDFTVHYEDASGYYMDYTFTQLVGTPTTAVVDDSPDGVDLGSYWFDITQQAGLTADIISGDDAVTNSLGDYDIVIWGTSNATTDVLTANEIATIESFLDGGGKLILSGENIGEFDGTADLLANYFMAEHELDEVGDPYVRLDGVADGPFPESMVVIMGEGGANTTEAASSITPLAGAEPFFFYYPINNIGAVGYQGDTFMTAYLAFNVESVSGVNDSWTSADVIWSILNWMGATTAVDEPGMLADTPLPVDVALSGYPNPFNAAMTVKYQLPASAEVRLEVVNVLGQTVAELQRGQVTAGVHEVTWDASAMSSGVYFLNLRAGSDVRMEKVLLLK